MTGGLTSGTYSVVEHGAEGWTLTSATCSDGSTPGSIDLAEGETVTCTFVNTKNGPPPGPQPGTIVVQKQTIPDGDPADFDFIWDHEVVFELSDGEQETFDGLKPGTYSVSEPDPGAPWALTSATCSDGSTPGSIALAEGETVTCTFTNTKNGPPPGPQPGTIVVQKQTIPDGDQADFDFIWDHEVVFELSDGEQETFDGLKPGTYSVSEPDPGLPWSLTSATCSDGSEPDSIDLAEGETVTCTFTNTKKGPTEPKPGTIIVQKQTIPDGDETEFDFTFEEDDFSLSDGESETFEQLPAGNYSVDESTPEGWTLTSATCSDGSEPDSIDLAEGETVTCTFTNTKKGPTEPKPGTIIVQKQTIPDGDETEFDFTFEEDDFSLSDGESETFEQLPAGNYSVDESTPEGWTLTSATCSDGSEPDSIDLAEGETVTCVFVNSRNDRPNLPSSINVSKSASPTTLKEPGGEVTYSVTITNTSAEAGVTITEVFDNRFGDLDDEGGNGYCDVPINLAAGASANCQFRIVLIGGGGTSHVNVVTAYGFDEDGDAVSDSDDARVDFTTKVIDLVIVKDATSPTALNGTVQYTMTVTNKGPDTATNVELADPAPAGITYLTANASQGTCTVAPALITCSLGTIAAGQTVTVNATGRATQTGDLTNTATVTGSGGGEANPADNTDSATTMVPAPLLPPTAKPTPKPKPKPTPEYCLALTVTPKMIKADGKPDTISVKVTAGKKAVAGVKVLVTGTGVRKTGRTNGRGIALIKVNLNNPGLIRITTLGKRDSCGPKRIGVVGIFLPPVTG